MLDMNKIAEIISSLGIRVFTFDRSIYSNYIVPTYQWYKGSCPYHVRKFYNGNSNIRVEKAKLHMAKRISEDIASLTFNENAIINIEDEPEKEYLMGFDEMSGILGENDFFSMMSKSIELMAGLGTAGVEILVENMLQVDNKFIPSKNTKIKLAKYDALHILPISYDNRGHITEVCFIDEYQIKNDTFLELRLHILNEKGNYVIINKKCKVDYYTNKNDVNNFIYLENSGIIEEFDTGSNIPWFTCLKMNKINSYDPNSPMGASAYGDAIDELKAVDDAFNTLCGEFRYSQKKVYYSKSLLEKNENGNFITPDEDDSTREVYYYTGETLNSNPDSKDPIHEYNPQIRSKELTEGIELVLDILSFKAGLGKGFYKFTTGGLQKTATEVISSNSELYRNICKLQIGIEKNILEILRALLYVSNYVFGTTYNVDCKISIKFDQSLTEDSAAERERALKEVSLGLLTVDEYRAMYYPELGVKKVDDSFKDIEVIDRV